MKKILKSIFCKKRIPIIIIFVLLAVVFVLICVMLFSGRRSGQRDSVQTDFAAGSISDSTQPEVEAESEPKVKEPAAEELYAPYREGFDAMRISEQNTLCLLDGSIATGLQGSFGEDVFLYGVVHGHPVNYIGSSFELPDKVRSLELPDTVTAVLSQEGPELDKKGAFYEDTELETFIPSEKLSYIGDKAFYGCTSLGNVFFPIGLSHIGSRAFYGCTALESIGIYGETSIGEGAFAGCSSLKDVYLSENVRRVGLGAFENTPFYEALTDEFCIIGDVLVKYNGSSADIVIPDGVRVIADGVFAGRLSLKSVVIPASVEYIGNSAFRSCARLSSVQLCEGASPVIGVNAFDGCTQEAVEMTSGLYVDERDEFYSELTVARAESDGASAEDEGAEA